MASCVISVMQSLLLLGRVTVFLLSTDYVMRSLVTMDAVALWPWIERKALSESNNYFVFTHTHAKSGALFLVREQVFNSVRATMQYATKARLICLRKRLHNSSS